MVSALNKIHFRVDTPIVIWYNTTIKQRMRNMSKILSQPRFTPDQEVYCKIPVNWGWESPVTIIEHGITKSGQFNGKYLVQTRYKNFKEMDEGFLSETPIHGELTLDDMKIKAN